MLARYLALGICVLTSVQLSAQSNNSGVGGASTAPNQPQLNQSQGQYPNSDTQGRNEVYNNGNYDRDNNGMYQSEEEDARSMDEQNDYTDAQRRNLQNQRRNSYEASDPENYPGQPGRPDSPDMYQRPK